MRTVGHARQAATLYVVGYLVLVVAIAWNFHQVAYQANYRAWQLCESSNDARIGLKAVIRANSEQIKEQAEILIAASKLGPQRQMTSAEKRSSDEALRFYQQATEDAHSKALKLLDAVKTRDCGKKP